VFALVGLLVPVLFFTLPVVTVCLYITIVVAEKAKKKYNRLSSALYWWWQSTQSEHL